MHVKLKYDKKNKSKSFKNSVQRFEQEISIIKGVKTKLKPKLNK